MNIFFLHKNPQISARLLCNKHIVKMISETTQIIVTVLSKHNIKFCDIKPTHHNNPPVLWTGLNIANFEWLVEYLHCLHYEYYIRYGKEKNKTHSYFGISKLIPMDKAEAVLSYSDEVFMDKGYFAMSGFKSNHKQAEKAYMEYYKYCKSHIYYDSKNNKLNYKNVNAPNFLIEFIKSDDFKIVIENQEKIKNDSSYANELFMKLGEKYA